MDIYVVWYVKPLWIG